MTTPTPNIDEGTSVSSSLNSSKLAIAVLKSAPDDGCWRKKMPAAYTGTAASGSAGPPIGSYDISFSDTAYLFQFSLPRVRNNKGSLLCEVNGDGMMKLVGEMMVHDRIKIKSSEGELEFQRLTENLCTPGPFLVTLRLPGPVDPRLFKSTYSDGILEIIVMKHDDAEASMVKDTSQ